MNFDRFAELWHAYSNARWALFVEFWWLWLAFIGLIAFAAFIAWRRGL